MIRQFEIGVKAFIQNSEGQYLVLKRAKPYVGEDFCRWDIPGGRINPKETLDEALGREIKEETGLVLSEVKEILAAQDIMRIPEKHTVKITYKAVCEEEEVHALPEEHTEFQWITL